LKLFCRYNCTEMRNIVIITLVIFLLFFRFEAYGQIEIAYLTDDFLNYYALSKDSPAKQKIISFKTEVYDKAPLIYENIFNDIKWIGQEPDDWLLRKVDEFKSIEMGFKELSGKLNILFDSSLAEFQKAFPDFKPYFNVCILHSLGIRAGGPVEIEDKTVLMFGVDQMAKYFNFQNFKPFFQHELTHIYHSQHFIPVNNEKYSKDALYNFLWREGLAVYFSSVLNPCAREIEVFMVDSLPQKTNRVIQLIAPEIVENLYSTEQKLIERYFWTSSKDPVVPKTAGYYLGYYLVKEIAKDYSLVELVGFKENDFIPKMEQILKNLSN
jgi:hypothetical protein